MNYFLIAKSQLLRVRLRECKSGRLRESGCEHRGRGLGLRDYLGHRGGLREGGLRGKGLGGEGLGLLERGLVQLGGQLGIGAGTYLGI